MLTFQSKEYSTVPLLTLSEFTATLLYLVSILKIFVTFFSLAFNELSLVGLSLDPVD